MFVSRKISRALFSWNTRFEIRPFVLLRRISLRLDAKFGDDPWERTEKIGIHKRIKFL